MTARIAGINSTRSCVAASRMSRACASAPPTSAAGSVARVEFRSAATTPKARLDDGGASITTDHFVNPDSERPASVAETTPGVAWIACRTDGAWAVGATTSVGLASPAGKCSATTE